VADATLQFGCQTRSCAFVGQRKGATRLTAGELGQRKALATKNCQFCELFMLLVFDYCKWK
jgi:hypothetical protein